MNDDPFLSLLAHRDELRAICPNAELDRILNVELKAAFVSALRTATSKLNAFPCADNSPLSARISSELRWLENVARSIGAFDA